MNKKILIWIIGIFLLCSFALADMETDTLSYYTFDNDDVSGTTVIDVAGTNDGAIYSATTGAVGKIEEAFDFDGNDDYITINNNMFSSFPTTVSAWVYVSTGDNAIILSGDRQHFYDGISLDVDNKVSFRYGDGSDDSTGNRWSIYSPEFSVPFDEWVHVAVIIESFANKGSSKIYINGIEQSLSTSGFGSSYSMSSTYFIGRQAGFTYYSGKIDEVGIWDRALTSDEITQLYNDGAGIQYPFTTNFTIDSQIYGSYQLQNFSAVVDGVSYNTTTGSIITNVNDSRISNITITDGNHINQEHLNWNTSNNLVFNYSIFNGTAKNNRTNESISAFTTNYTVDGTEYSKSTENESILFYLNSETYNFNTTSVGYAPSVADITLSEGLNNYTFGMYAEESVLINIYNASSGDRLTQNVTIQAEIGEDITTYNTSTGEIFLNDTIPGEYRFTLMSDGFENTYYVVTIGNNSFQRLNAYMNELTTDSTIFTLRNKDTGDTIEDAILSVKRLLDDEWALINSLKSDLSGKVTFTYEPNLRYKFTATADGYKKKEFELNPIIFSSYNVYLEQSVNETLPDSQRMSVAYSPGIYYNNKNNTVTFDFSSPNGGFEAFGYTATYDNTTISGSGTNSYGETLSDDLKIVGAEFGDKVYVSYYYILTDSDRVDVDLVYSIADPDADANTFMNVGDDYGMGFFERTLIITIIIIVIGGAAYVFGGVVASGIAVLLIMGYFLKIQFISGWILIPSMILIGISVAWRGTK